LNALEYTQLVTNLFTIVSGIAMPVLAYITFRIMRGQKDLQARSLDIAATSNLLAQRSKQADVVIHANTRFDALVRAKYEGKDTPRTYYMRFWSLQLDQFDAWELDLLPNRLYQRWLEQRYIDWRADTTYEGVGRQNQPESLSFQQGWEMVRKEWAQNDQRFIGFMEDVMIRYGAEKAMDIHRVGSATHRHIDA
jgi:hypothetical protein